jgi:hypothetical protein
MSKNLKEKKIKEEIFNIPLKVTRRVVERIQERLEGTYYYIL